MLKRYVASSRNLLKRQASALPSGQLRQALSGALVLLVAAGIGVAVVSALAERPHVHLRFLAGWLVVAVAGFTAVELMQAEMWRRLVAVLGVRIEPRRSAATWCTSAVARYVPTNMLMPVLRVSLSRSQRVPRSICAASLVYEAALSVCGALSIGAYFIVGLPVFAGDDWRWGVFLIPLISMAALHPRCARLAGDRVLGKLGREPLPVYLSSDRLLAFVAGYAVSFLLAGGSLLAVVLACHSLSPQDAPAVIGAYSVGFVAALLGFLLPGGLGARELALVAALSPVIPVLTATAVAVAVRLIQIFTELLLVLVTQRVAARHEARSLVGAALIAELKAAA